MVILAKGWKYYILKWDSTDIFGKWEIYKTVVDDGIRTPDLSLSINLCLQI